MIRVPSNLILTEMKIILLLLIVYLFTIKSNCQPLFILNLEQPEIDAITDAVEIGDKFYFIQSRVINNEPGMGISNYDSYADLITTDRNGEILDIHNLNGYRTQYQRILKVVGNEIYLIGYIKTDSCKSSIIISKYNIKSQNITHLSALEICDYVLLQIKLINGLNGQLIVEEMHGINHGYIKYIYQIDSSYTLIPTTTDAIFSATFSIDFSRHGYLIATSDFYYFYDSNFTFRKQIHRNEANSYSNETHMPFGKNLILIESVQGIFGQPFQGIQVRLIDSTITTKKGIGFIPSGDVPFMNLPFFNGLDLKNDNEIWVSGYFDYHPPDYDTTIYFIAKLDSNLNIVCQHFLGYDTKYRLNGIKVLGSGGAMVFGSHLREGYPLNEGEDIFAIRVGENCELPATVSTHRPQESLLSISAYPNPGINDLTFSVNGFDSATLTVEFIDEAGHALFRQDDLTNSIHVPELPVGQYFYRILKGEKLMGIGAWVKQ